VRRDAIQPQAPPTTWASGTGTKVDESAKSVLPLASSYTIFPPKPASETAIATATARRPAAYSSLSSVTATSVNSAESIPEKPR
jgi:hypothetical protein